MIHGLVSPYHVGNWDNVKRIATLIKIQEGNEGWLDRFNGENRRRDRCV